MLSTATRNADMPFFKKLQKTAGDISILTRVIPAIRSDEGVSSEKVTPNVPGGPIGLGVVCESCLQPASHGLCRSKNTGSLRCGPWISEGAMDRSPRNRRKAISNVPKLSPIPPESRFSPKGRRSMLVRSYRMTGLSDTMRSRDDSDIIFKFRPKPMFPESNYWIGCGFIYCLKNETIKMEITQNGDLSRSFSNSNRALFAEFTLLKDDHTVKKTVNLGTVGLPKSAPVKLTFQEYSCYRVQHMSVQCSLYVGQGLFRAAELIDFWTVPLTECHFLYSRTKWHHVKGRCC